MQLVLLSGVSGSGKSVALKALEDPEEIARQVRSASLKSKR